MNEDNDFYPYSVNPAEPSATSGADESPAHTAPYGYTTPSQTPQPQPARTAPAYTAAAASGTGSTSQKTKTRRGMSIGGVIALCLVCALLAAAVSAGVTYTALRRGTAGPVLESAAATPVPVLTTVETGATGDVNDTAAYIYELAKQQVVGIRTDITYYNIFGQSSAASVSGSGVIITDDGYILTNHHVVEDAINGNLQVTVMMYDETTYDAEIVGYDADNDLALLKIDASGLNAAQLGDSEDLTVGQSVYAVGNPLGELNYSMTSGIVSATNRTITTESNVAMNVFQIDAAVNSGNSGGPVYNSLGQVIGIVSAKYASTGVEGIGFAIPISEAAHIANQILEYGYVADRAYLGITTATVTSSIAENYGLVEGAYVNGVNEGSAAETAGMQKGDIIVALNGETVAGSSELTSMLKQYHAGDTATITVARSGETVDLTVTFDAKPQQTESDDANSQASGEPNQGGQYYSFGGGDIEDFFRQFFGGPFGY